MKSVLGRLLAVLLCLAMLGAAGLAEVEDVELEQVETEVAESEEFELDWGDEGMDLPAPEEDDFILDEGFEDALLDAAAFAYGAAMDEAAPVEAAAEPVPAMTRKGDEVTFHRTVELGDDTWHDINLLPGSDLSGYLAKVHGLLVLNNVRINGVPAGQVNLYDYFEMTSKGRVYVVNDSPFQLDVNVITLNKDDSYTLTPILNGEAIRAKYVTWTSSDSHTASVSRGRVKGRGSGTVVITASYEGMEATCVVLATNYKKVSKVRLDRSRLTLALNAAIQLNATIRPADAHDQSLIWVSSNPEVASVDENGMVSGLSGGRAVITAISSNGKHDRCKVTVEEIKPTGISLNPSYASLQPGETLQLTPALKPETVSNPGVIYASSDPAVATVDETGLVTAVSYGRASITAACAADNSVSTLCIISIREPGAKRMEGLVIGINPGHQIKTIKTKLPLAPGSSKTAYAVKTGAGGHYSGVPEYEDNLQIGLKLARILEEEGARVVITRTSNDVMLTNIDRAQMLNAANVDVALQLHCNSSNSSSHEGCSGYIRTTGDWVEESRAIAACLTQEISRVCGCKNLGVKIYNDYMSLNWTTTPSVLLEMGYLSNRKEDLLLSSDPYRELMAQGIFEGLCLYFGR